MYFYVLAVKTLFRSHEIRAQITRHPQILPKSRSDTNIAKIRAVTRSHCMHAPSFTPEKILIASFARSRGCTPAGPTMTARTFPLFGRTC